MNDENGGNGLFTTIKNIVDAYLQNRKMTSVVIGVYNGTAMMLESRLPVPMSMISGNMKSRLVSGDRVVLLRNDGGREYYILEITGRPYLINNGE